jgi:hypothetical protein
MSASVLYHDVVHKAEYNFGFEKKRAFAPNVHEDVGDHGEASDLRLEYERRGTQIHIGVSAISLSSTNPSPGVSR